MLPDGSCADIVITGNTLDTVINQLSHLLNMTQNLTQWAIVPSLAPIVVTKKPQKKSPCNTLNTNGSVQDRANFFSHLSELQNVARALDVPENYIVGLASYESGWLNTHNQGLHNLWGLTNAGGNNINFQSYAAGDAYFISRVGPYTRGAQSISAFEAGLMKEGYNSVNPSYWSTLTDRINSIPKWEDRCGVQ